MKTLLFALAFIVSFIVLIWIGNQIFYPKQSTETFEIDLPRYTNSNTTNAPSQKQQESYIGETTTFNGLEVTVLSAGENQSSSEYFSPEAGYKYYYAEILIKNINKTPSGYANSLNFTLKDSNSFSYNYGFVIGGKTPELTSENISQGESLRGFVNFEIPSDSVPTVLKYQPDFFGDTLSINLAKR